MTDSAITPFKMISDHTDSRKQGIVSILRSDFEISTHAPPSLRRTLSADMSSKNWLNQHGFSSMKKIASAEGFSVSFADLSPSSSASSSDEEFDFRNSIHEEKNDKMKIETEKQGEFDAWSSILSQKAADAAKSLPVPYVHPQMKKSKSSLSQKSLEICTESLGSETGSDGFSSYSPSEVGEMEGETREERKPETFAQNSDCYEWRPMKYNHKKSPPRSFPPPIPSLSGRDGSSVRMQSRRENGRLILEAVTVPSQKNFRADRRDGRLVLSFIADQNDESIEDEVYEEEEEEETEEVKEIEEEDENDQDFMELSSSVMNFHRLSLMMKKPNELVNRNSVQSNELKGSVLKEQDAWEAPTLLSQSLPPRPKQVARMIHSPAALTPAPAPLNAYEYYWRSKPAMKSGNPMMKNSSRKVTFANNSVGDENQQVLVLRGNKRDYLVPLSNGCKIPRRSLLLWEPSCIATT